MHSGTTLQGRSLPQRTDESDLPGEEGVRSGEMSRRDQGIGHSKRNLTGDPSNIINMKQEMNKK